MLTHSLPSRSVPMTTKVLKKYLNEPSPLDGFFELKELSLVSHIEALKRIANEDSPSQNFNCSSNNTCLPVLLNVPNGSEQSSLSSIQNRPSSNHNAWTVDPASVPGNLRGETTSKLGNLSIEEILSRGSSVSDKVKEETDELPCVDKNFVRARRKSLKSSKKKPGKKKSTSLGAHSTATLTILPKFTKGTQSALHSSAAGDIDGLSAFCQGVTIHEKPGGNSNVKKSQDKSKLHNTLSSHQKPSFASKSLNAAIVEYSRKNASYPEVTLHKKKTSNSIDEDSVRLTKVYLSEKQSGHISDSGTTYPCAPPATPTAEQMKKYEYVPSLHDIRAQRSFRNRLQLMETRAAKKEKKKQDENLRLEQLSMRERKIEMKRRQRLEIYALNKIMTDLEHERFHQFMSSAGSNV
ncbi:uncharacterized protein LOC101856722 [Aplysia californica]|uniref:Small vasohibin-binding protein n=1 Tax=Aplysia californica TaxID=6500 RepID=A0ABM0JHW2_APLCA|nr:uncharacterized protein LOC101856722 [Aplysia californica]